VDPSNSVDATELGRIFYFCREMGAGLANCSLLLQRMSLLGYFDILKVKTSLLQAVEDHMVVRHRARCHPYALASLYPPPPPKKFPGTDVL
jgi:hypothetical protein